MGAVTKIQWATHTFNPWRGCAKVHAGCANCYAEKQAKRNPGTLGVWGADGTRVVASEEMWAQPVKWNKAAFAAAVRRRVFCASLADVFESWARSLHHSSGTPMWRMHAPNGHPCNWGAGWVLDDPNAGVPLTMDDVRGRLFNLIDATPALDWLLVTKRPENIHAMTQMSSRSEAIFPGMPGALGEPQPSWTKYRKNVWHLTSVSDQPTANEMVPRIVTLPKLGAVRGLSIEPLLGPISLRAIRALGMPLGTRFGDTSGLAYTIDWVIIGGESGPKARPCDIAGIRSLIAECRGEGIPVFVKQLGERPILNDPVLDEWPDYVHWRADESQQGFRLHGLRDSKGGDPDEWPADLRVREFPVVNV